MPSLTAADLDAHMGNFSQYGKHPIDTLLARAPLDVPISVWPVRIGLSEWLRGDPIPPEGSYSLYPKLTTRDILNA